MMNGVVAREHRWMLLALATLLLTAGAQRAWNSASIPPLLGYDVPGHAGYLQTVAMDARIPHPFEGWSTFHPPLYYLLGGATWRALAPLGPQAVLLGLRAIGELAGLAAGLVAFFVVRRLQGDWRLAWVAAALVLFLPASQLAGWMIGNEGFTMGLVALSLLPLLALQADPRDLRMAALGGLGVGLALTAKYSGIFLLGACVAPYLRRDLDRRMLAAAALGIAMIAAVAGPAYLRNVWATGSPIPMTREREPMRSAEASFVIRPRQVRDYLGFDPNCLLRPSIYHLTSGTREEQMARRCWMSVVGLAHASWWYDAQAVQIPFDYHRDGVYSGTVMGLAGILPSALVLCGFLSAGVDFVRRRGRSRDAPLFTMALLGSAIFVVFTWRAPAVVAVKGSYLLPLAIPAAVFFGRAAAALRPRLRAGALLLSLFAVIAAGIVFTDGMLFESEPLPDTLIEAWRGDARTLDSSAIVEGMYYLKETR